MAHIRCVPEGEATGLLARIYEAARSRAGKVFNILRVQSLEPAVLQPSIQLYAATMHDDSALDRFTREAIAVVVSKTNGCHY